MKFIKTISIIVLLTVMSPVFAQEINWVNIKDAEVIAKKTDKPIYIDIYAIPCKWCVVMDQTTFANPDVIEYLNENYVAVKFDGSKRDTILFQGEKLSHRALAKKLGVRGYPTSAFTDNKMEELDIQIGYFKPKKFLDMLKKHKQDLE